MSEAEKIREVPKPQNQEQPKEPTAPKTSQSAFDKALEQARVLQQSPLVQGKLNEQGGQEYRVREMAKGQESRDEKRKDDDGADSKNTDKTRQKERKGDTATREAIGGITDKKGFRGDSGHGGQRQGGFGGERGKRQLEAISKKLAEARSLLSAKGEHSFLGKMAQAKAGALKLTPQQMQGIINQIVQSIRVGKNSMGWSELCLILRESVFLGLRLRFTSKHGKVTVQFETADKRVRDLFTAESGKIRAALEEKWVAVSEVKVG